MLINVLNLKNLTFVSLYDIHREVVVDITTQTKSQE